MSTIPSGPAADAAALRVTAAAVALMALSMGSRSAFGLFLSPLNTATGLGLAGVSLAVALGQLALGAAQPLVGALAERHGAARVIACGALGLALATALVPAADTLPALALAMVAMAAAGCAVGSNALLLGEVGRRVPAAQRGLALGLVGAGGSAGQMLMAPGTQALIDSRGWVPGLWALAAAALLALPLARAFGAGPAPARESAAGPRDGVAAALRDPRFWLVAGGFGTCGFHVAFLGAHMPGIVERCGLPASLAGTWLAVLGAANIAGSLAVGLLLRRHAPAPLLAGLYGARALGIVLLLALPPTPAVLLGFAVLMGLSYMAVLPPTSQLVAQRFGVARLGTLLGLLMLVHQVGSFAGVWLGGLIVEASRGDALLWRIDIALALLAAALQLPLVPGGASAAQPGMAAAKG